MHAALHGDFSRGGWFDVCSRREGRECAQQRDKHALSCHWINLPPIEQVDVTASQTVQTFCSHTHGPHMPYDHPLQAPDHNDGYMHSVPETIRDAGLSMRL